MGVVYWYALPLWLGFPQQSMIYIHWLMLLCSIFFSVKCFAHLKLKVQGNTVSLAGKVLASIISAAVHIAFLYPVLNNSLADPPATLFALCGFWFLIIASISSQKIFVYNLAAGLAFGMAAWIRAFYLYPVLGLLLGAFIAVLLYPFRKKALTGLFVALIPIGAQYAKTYSLYGYVSYLAKDQTAQWTQIHLNDSSMGYDTLLPMAGHRWQTKCESVSGPLDSFKKGSYLDAACVYAGKMNFYLGSYAKETYIPMYGKGMLTFTEDIGNVQGWAYSNLKTEMNVAPAPDGTVTAEKFTVTVPASEGSGTVFAWANNIQKAKYTFSVWLWAETPHTVAIGIFRPEDNFVFASKIIHLTTTPKRYWVTARYTPVNPNAPVASLGVSIGKVDWKEVTIGKTLGDSFFAWGAKLEQSAKMTAYDSKEAVPPRLWSTWLYGANVIMMLLTLCFYIQSRKLFKVEAWLGAFFVALSFGQALTIIPEQRFIILVHIVIWLLGVVALTNIVRRFRVKEKI